MASRESLLQGSGIKGFSFWASHYAMLHQIRALHILPLIHWLWRWVLCAFSNQHISTFLRVPALFWTYVAHPSYNLGVFKNTNTWKCGKAQEAPQEPVEITSPSAWSTQNERQQKRGAELYGMRGKKALGFSSNSKQLIYSAAEWQGLFHK